MMMLSRSTIKEHMNQQVIYDRSSQLNEEEDYENEAVIEVD
jgi:hypothetical protein